jgi:hypothetical protein
MATPHSSVAPNDLMQKQEVFLRPKNCCAGCRRFAVWISYYFPCCGRFRCQQACYIHRVVNSALVIFPSSGTTTARRNGINAALAHSNGHLSGGASIWVNYVQPQKNPHTIRSRNFADRNSLVIIQRT